MEALNADTAIVNPEAAAAKPADVPRAHGIARLATRVFGAPLLISQEKFDVIVRVLAPRIYGELPEPSVVGPGDPAAEQKNYQVTADGIAVIPIAGPLVNKGSWLDALCGMSSYSEIESQIEDAATDPKIKGILLDVDSPGGEVAGCFDLADVIYQARATKPCFAIADNDAFSAAYALASSAEKIFATRTSGLGSIGVILSHVDESQADKQAGLKYTVITAGSKKADFNSHAPLSAEAKATAREIVDKSYGLFVSTVARNRGLSEDAVRGTEAGLYFGADAVAAGLADAMGTMSDAMMALRARIAADSMPPAMPADKKKMPMMPDMATAIPETVASEDVTAAIESAMLQATEIAELCVLAGLPAAAKGLLERRATVEQARTDLQKMRVDASESLDGHHAPVSNRTPDGKEKEPSSELSAAVDRLNALALERKSRR